MATKIRLARFGRKKKPFYRVVIADIRSPRDGRHLEKIGYYDPIASPAVIEINKEKALYWLSKGATPTDTVRNLLSGLGILLEHDLLKTGKSEDFIKEELQKFGFLQEQKLKNIEEKKRKAAETKAAKGAEAETAEVEATKEEVVEASAPVEEPATEEAAPEEPVEASAPVEEPATEEAAVEEPLAPKEEAAVEEPLAPIEEPKEEAKSVETPAEETKEEPESKEE